MALAKATIKKLAEHLDSAHADCRDVVKITDEHPGLTLQEAYDIQAAQRVLKLGRGSRIAGHKAGLTSRAKMKQMGVETPCFGFVTDDMVVPEGGHRGDEAAHPPQGGGRNLRRDPPRAERAWLPLGNGALGH